MKRISKADKNKLKKEQKAILKEREIHHKKILKLAKQNFYLEKVAPVDSYISLRNINKIYPNHVQAVYDFNFDIKRKEFIVFVGPSGCGKSTTLRMIAGLEDITFGDLFIDGIYANELPPKDREIGMVFQSYALYPHMSVYENMAFALRVKHMNNSEIDERIKKAAEILQISEYLDRKPSALSGGQCQRVALGRAIVTDAKVFLMDEPLSNLDAKLRVAMRSEIVKLHKALNATTIYVTHDQTEAMTMADRIVVMSKGYVQQIGTPLEIFNTPKNLFVATFIGSPAMNLIDGSIKGNTLTFTNGDKFELDKGTDKAIEQFYINEIENTKKEIFAWKKEFLSREQESSYKKIYSNNLVKLNQLNKYLNKFDTTILETLNFADDILLQIARKTDAETSKTMLDKLLFEYLYAVEKTYNPTIMELDEKLKKLEDTLSREDKNIIFGIRPEHVLLSLSKSSYKANIVMSELLGSEYYVHMNFNDKEILAKVDAKELVDNSKLVNIEFRKDCFHIFDPITTKRI